MLALRYILGALIRAVIMAVGLPGNALIIIVYSKKQRKSGTDAFILGLAITDFVACLTFPLKIYSYVTTEFTNDFLCKTMYFTQYWTQFVGVFLTGIITIDRYIAVCKPLKKRLSPRQATIIVSLLCALAMVFAIPTLVWTGVQKFGVFASRCTYNLSNMKVSPRTFTWVLHDSNDALFYGTLVMITFMYSRIWLAVYRRTRAKIGCVPSSITTVSGQVSKSEQTAETSTVSKPDTTDNVNLSDCKTENTGTTANGVITIVSGPKNGDSSGAKGSDEGSSFGEISLKPDPKPKSNSKPGKTPMQARASNKTTKMIFIITIIFFVSWVPAKLWVLQSRTKIKTNNQVQYNIFYLSTFMVNINQAVNPFVYSFCNENFRKECVRVMRHFRQCRLS